MNLTCIFTLFFVTIKLLVVTLLLRSHILSFLHQEFLPCLTTSRKFASERFFWRCHKLLLTFEISQILNYKSAIGIAKFSVTVPIWRNNHKEYYSETVGLSYLAYIFANKIKMRRFLSILFYFHFSVMLCSNGSQKQKLR